MELLMVWSYLNQAIFSLLRLSFLCTGQFVFSIYLSLDEASINTMLSKAPANRTNIVWQTFEVLFVKQNVCWFGHYTNTCLTNIFCLCQAKNVFETDKQNVLVKLCLSWWPNGQACLTSKIRNV